jgi:hypothetical protein
MKICVLFDIDIRNCEYDLELRIADCGFRNSGIGSTDQSSLFELGASPFGLPTSFFELRRDKTTPQDDGTSRLDKFSQIMNN